MEPIKPNSRPERPQAADADNEPFEDNAAGNEPAEPTKPRLSVKDQFAKNWIVLVVLLVGMMFGGLFLWIQSAKRADLAAQQPVAAVSANIDPQIPSAQSAPQPAPVTPSAQIEEQRRADQAASYNQPAAGPPEDVRDVFAVDTAGRAQRRKQRVLLAAAARRDEAARQAADVDTLETTVQDPVTGSYRSQSLLVPRRRAGSGGSRAAGQAAALPARDTDGTPFETDPNVLAMLSGSPPETRAQYEKMTGRRYRDPAQAALLIAQQEDDPNNAGGAVPDGFNTVKVGNAVKIMAQGQQQQLVPDVFYKCVINGPQTVRTGSVVIMRLVEDAVVSGVTFPKNMIFAAVATVGTNNISLKVDRLGPTRVSADIYNFNYMPGIMIDPNKKIPKADGAGNELRGSATTEVTTAIDRSASAANSVTGVAGRMLTTLIGRSPTNTRLRDVSLPDGYPILITTAAAGQLGPQTPGGATTSR